MPLHMCPSMLMPHRRQGCGGTRQGDHWRRRQRVVRDLYHKQGSPGSHAQHPCRRGNEVIESCSDNVVAQVKEDDRRQEQSALLSILLPQTFFWLTESTPVPQGQRGDRLQQRGCGSAGDGYDRRSGGNSGLGHPKGHSSPYRCLAAYQGLLTLAVGATRRSIRHRRMWWRG